MLTSHQTPAPLNCPRCNSIKTKFCYYNNYNKSQPRHFCKSCKRHWTEGGTLRDVPVGGTRRNKRRKLCSESNTSSFDGIQQERHQYHLGIGTNNAVDATLTLPPLSNFAFTNLVPSDDLVSPFCFTYSSLFQSSNLDDIARLFEGTPDDLSNSSTTSHTITSEVINPSLELPSTSNLVDGTTGWSWDDLTTLVSSTDINLPGDAYQSEV